MKTNNSPFSIILLFTALCCFSCNTDRRQTLGVETDAVMQADSLFEPTGDAKLDSLLQLAVVTPCDTNLAKLYFDIGRMYDNNDFEKAKEYYQKLEILSEQLDWNKGRYLYLKGILTITWREGLSDSALVICRQALELAKKENNEEWIANINFNIGTTYYSKNWFEEALHYYMEILPFYEKSNKIETLGYVYLQIGNVYLNLSLFEKAIEFGKKALELRNDSPDVLFALAKMYYGAQEIETARFYYRETIRICELQNNTYLLEFVYFYLAHDALSFYDLNNAEMYLKKMQENGGNILYGSVTYFLLLGRLEALKGNFAQAENYALQALELSIELDDLVSLKSCYLLLCELTLAQRKFLENTQYWDKWSEVEKAIANETSISSAAEMAAKYETEKKELKISVLEKEKRLLAKLGIASGISLLLALTTFLFLWRWTLQKRQLAEQKIRQLEQEKQLVATQAVLDGETRERARLARDLHDGLGSMLTGVKLNLLEMKKGMMLKFEDVERFDGALGLLDQSVSEMRRVSHHLMPDSLSRFGLKPAVSDFCSNLPSVRFSYYGDESRLDPKLEVMIYRSIHELVNNALKHAGANIIMVQIIQEPDRIAFTVQDDGCGFDPSSVTQGMGLQNISMRVTSHNGVFNIDSRIGEGTEINVELRVENV